MSATMSSAKLRRVRIAPTGPFAMYPRPFRASLQRVGPWSSASSPPHPGVLAIETSMSVSHPPHPRAIPRPLSHPDTLGLDRRCVKTHHMPGAGNAGLPAH